MGFQLRASNNGRYDNGLPVGYSKLPAWKSWNSMKNRCLVKENNRYQMYGGRGIKICDEWLEFVNFYRDMGNRPDGMTLDRIDSNGDYCKENCRWASPIEQSNNTRRNVFIKYNGENMTVSQWAKKLGLERSVLEVRLYKYRWPLEKALTAKKFSNRSKTHCKNGHILTPENCYPPKGKNLRICKLCRKT